MGNVKLAIRTTISFLLFICIYGFNFSVTAESSNSQNLGVNTDGRHEVTFIRDSDNACTQCHKDSKETRQGTHGEKVVAEIGRDLKCVECHNTIGPDHRENPSQVTKFSAAQSQIGTHKTLLDFDAILKATGNCTECHTSERLQEKTWVHDVHAKKATCSSCHVIHADGEKEGMQALERKAQIAQCVDCHKDFNLKKEDKGE
ncbi:cytochrome c nitrite reductase pentaheme subunit [Moritella sp. 24]|uniref:cytochrome c nitrite reductase pentaheme subunit n=1 Tax=Moritella sp. 24 TaxID=2746230 RepID=UPI001BA552BA|nr:cytochrome c nitrite reductase pentaheme subunit [Moritella sp. 24]QUM76817.1 cytochrome c nitrite reductase pentaheme subunit [Moritella sp. 24]